MENTNLRPGHMTAHQAATALGITLGGVRQLVHRGRLKRAGGTSRQPWFTVADVATLHAERQQRASA